MAKKHATASNLQCCPKGHSAAAEQFRVAQAHAKGSRLAMVPMRIVRHHKWSIATVCLDAGIKQFAHVHKMGVTVALLVLPWQELYIPARPSGSQAFQHAAKHHLRQVLFRWIFSMVGQPKP